MPRFLLSLKVKIQNDCANKKALELKTAELHREAFRIFGPQVSIQVSSLGELGEVETLETKKPGNGVKNF